MGLARFPGSCRSPLMINPSGSTKSAHANSPTIYGRTATAATSAIGAGILRSGPAISSATRDGLMRTTHPWFVPVQGALKRRFTRLLKQLWAVLDRSGSSSGPAVLEPKNVENLGSGHGTGDRGTCLECPRRIGVAR